MIRPKVGEAVRSELNGPGRVVVVETAFALVEWAELENRWGGQERTWVSFGAFLEEHDPDAEDALVYVDRP